ncbi:MAG TPA: VWA domain-containing protein [Acidobacteriaceae bacterium]|jgi:VWFA-related protein|nr:VWA domain-containing protein [Acidobacteriaceae bacterium]
MLLRKPFTGALRGAAFSALVLLAATGPLHAQAVAVPPPPATPTTTLTVNAQLVNLPVVVRDKNGALVTTLTQADFALAVDGRPQPIRYFDRDNNLPLTLGLLVDTSGSVHSALNDERDASESFLNQMMTSPPGRSPDQAFLIQFAHEADLLQTLTPSVPKLRAALSQVGVEYRDDDQNRRNNSGSYGGHRGGFHGAGTTLYDALFLASSQLMQKQQGRKALIVLTDGEDRGSMETLASAIAAAQRAETVVYAIYFKGEQQHYGGFGGRHGEEEHVDGRKILAQITGATGGRMFEVSGKQTFAAIYSQIGDELRSQYRLGYIPNADTASDGFHRVALTLTKDKKLLIQTRDGYYAGS